MKRGDLSAAQSGAGFGRRSFLKYVGAAAAGAWAGQALGPLARGANTSAGGAAATVNPAIAGMVGGWVGADGRPLFAGVGYPIPLPGDDAAAGAGDAARLGRFEVRDDVVLPEGYRYDVLCRWGEVYGAPGHEVRIGFNHDYTGLTPVRDGSGDFWLIINHEYISARPWLQGAGVALGKKLVDEAGKVGGVSLAGVSADLVSGRSGLKTEVEAGVRAICEAGMADLGVSVLRVRRTADGRGLAVVKDARDHLRISGASGRTDTTVKFDFTGPGAALFGRKPVGTFSNCSGETTPWGTFLTCEENFQDQVSEFITPAGVPLPGDRKEFSASGRGHASGLPFEFEGLGTGLTPPLDGREYGWVCEVDPAGRTLKKHTLMGRYRHENVALRTEAGATLAAYLGDDRRGGHVYKFVSRGVVRDPADAANSSLFEDGTLYVARFDADFSGRWVALRPETPLARPEPGHMAGGTMWLPRRGSDGSGGGHVEVSEEGDEAVGIWSVEQWVSRVERFAGKAFAGMTLGDLCDKSLDAAKRQGVILADAYVMANAVGGTPCARPEDLEVHPGDRSVYIAFTDSTGSGDGSPDTRIFPDSRGTNSRQYGAIYRLEEAGGTGAAERFTWGKFVSSGEAADGGGGFACADNLVFDPSGHLWMVTDITTAAHNVPVSREGNSAPGQREFPGIFGNNALFLIPTSGASAGVPFCFATGPMECEMTGPTFTRDAAGELMLILSVQHPGELHGTRKPDAAETRRMRLRARDGSVFEQTRTVPIGSNFPDGGTSTPRPCVIVVRRA